MTNYEEYLNDIIKNNTSGARITVQVKSHPRPLTNKKWLKRWGTASFTIPANVLEQGLSATKECIRNVKKLGSKKPLGKLLFKSSEIKL